MPRVNINIVTWNSSDCIIACLKALDKQTYTDFQVLVIDNNSEDDTLEQLQGVGRLPNKLKICENKENSGFARAHNMGIRQADSEFILLVNPDAILTPGFVENMVKAIETDSAIGSVAGKLIQVDSAKEIGQKPLNEYLIDSAGLIMLRNRRQYLRGHLQSTSKFIQPDYIFGPDGACPLYRRTMLEDIKVDDEYFDESFVTHKEDVDLAWRAQLLGWKSIFTPEAVAFHTRTFRPGKRRGISKKVRMDAVKNRYLLLIKNELPSTFIKHAPYILFYDLKILVYLLFFEPSSLKGLVKVLRLMPQALRWRKYIMLRKKADKKYMLTWMK